MPLTRKQKTELAKIRAAHEPAPRVAGSLMGELSSSALRLRGEPLVVTEQHFAVTRSPEALRGALASLQGLAARAKDDYERGAVAGVLSQIEAAQSVRRVAASPELAARVKDAAARGDGNAKALLQAVSVAQRADMKDAALQVAVGLQYGDLGAVRVAQDIVGAASRPGPRQQAAKTAARMIGECCDACTSLHDEPIPGEVHFTPPKGQQSGKQPVRPPVGIRPTAPRLPKTPVPRLPGVPTGVLEPRQPGKVPPGITGKHFFKVPVPGSVPSTRPRPTAPKAPMLHFPTPVARPATPAIPPAKAPGPGSRIMFPVPARPAFPRPMPAPVPPRAKAPLKPLFRAGVFAPQQPDYNSQLK